MHCCFTTDGKTAHGYYDGVMKSTLTSAGGHLNGVFYNDQARKLLVFRLGDEWLIHKPT